jgi:hypothetical protein
MSAEHHAQARCRRDVVALDTRGILLYRGDAAGGHTRDRPTDAGIWVDTVVAIVPLLAGLLGDAGLFDQAFLMLAGVRSIGVTLAVTTV